MAESDELKMIKKLYGEACMQKCREWFPTILDHKGILLDILKSTFSTNCKNFTKDIEDAGLKDIFIDLINEKSGLFKKEEEKEEVAPVTESPFELMKKAGYTLKECTTEDEIQQYKKYYRPDEELCTFQGR